MGHWVGLSVFEIQRVRGSQCEQETNVWVRQSAELWGFQVGSLADHPERSFRVVC